MNPEASDAPPQVGLMTRDGFRRWWLARLLGQTAQGALLYGLLILIVDRTEHSFYGALFVACSIVPSLALGLLGGWVADRLPQRMLLIALDVTRGALVALLLRTNADLVTIFTVTLGIWAVHQFYSPTESAAMARLTSRDELSRGNALANLALILAQGIGMVALAPAMLLLPDERWLFGAVSALYFAAGWFHLRMGRLPGWEPGERRGVPLALRRGWRVAVADRPIFAALVDAVLIGVGMSVLVVIVPHYLERVLHTSASNTVFVFAPAALGLTLGLQLAPWLGKLLGHGRIATLGLVGFAAAIGAMGFVDQVTQVLHDIVPRLPELERAAGLSTRVATTMLLSVPAGVCSALANVGARTVMLERVPEDARGQLVATQSTLSNAIALLPTLGAGVAVDLLDVRPVAVLIALLLLAGAAAGRRIGAAQRGTSPRPGPAGATAG